MIVLCDIGKKEAALICYNFVSIVPSVLKGMMMIIVPHLPKILTMDQKHPVVQCIFTYTSFAVHVVNELPFILYSM